MHDEETLEQRLLSIARVEIGERQAGGRRKIWYRGAGDVGYLDGSGSIVLKAPEVATAYARLLEELRGLKMEYRRPEPCIERGV